jgi:hypothetical protein
MSTTPRRRAPQKAAVRPDKTYLTVRIYQIIADLIAGDGPYLRREALTPAKKAELVRVFKKLGIHWRRRRGTERAPGREA